MHEMLTKYERIALDPETSSVINALLYFDIFSYPLTKEEICNFLPAEKMSQIRLNAILKELEEQGLVYCYHGYYLLSPDEKMIERRAKGNKKAELIMSKARRYSALISSFPFVRAVCISGSLSKGFIDEEGDIDYFIITEPGRLWISRSLLILFKKLFLRNRHRYFCVNYFIDTEHLEIPDKNIFTATELLSLLPMNNPVLFERLLAQNSWTRNYLPNFNSRSTDRKENKAYHKRFIELAFNGPHGDWLDRWFMKMTIKRWNRKFHMLPAEQFEQSMRSRPYVSKHHPRNFQSRVLNSLESKRRDFESRFNVRLSND